MREEVDFVISVGNINHQTCVEVDGANESRVYNSAFVVKLHRATDCTDSMLTQDNIASSCPTVFPLNGMGHLTRLSWRGKRKFTATLSPSRTQHRHNLRQSTHPKQSSRSTFLSWRTSFPEDHNPTLRPSSYPPSHSSCAV